MKTKKTKTKVKPKPKKKKAGKLTDKQNRFVLEYQIDFNGKQAAIRAGYSAKSAEVQASTLLRNPKVQAAIRAGMDKTEAKLEVTAARIYEELSRIGLSNVKDFVKFDADGIVTIADSEVLSPEQAACIAEVVQSNAKGSSSFKFKLHDKLKALELMGKHKKMFTDKVEHSGNFTVVMRDYSKEGEKK